MAQDPEFYAEHARDIEINRVARECTAMRETLRRQIDEACFIPLHAFQRKGQRPGKPEYAKRGNVLLPAAFMGR